MLGGKTGSRAYDSERTLFVGDRTFKYDQLGVFIKSKRNIAIPSLA